MPSYEVIRLVTEPAYYIILQNLKGDSFWLIYKLKLLFPSFASCYTVR